MEIDPKEEQKPIQKVGQDQIHDLLFEGKLSWQSIIYDLINTEQLDPWDIDIILLANKYMGKVSQLEEANFYVSSKVLLAASLLLRMKSDLLLNQDLPSLDEILFGKKEEKKYEQERIELDDEIPELVPRTPLPRFKKVTLQELMGALNKAIKTENRRISKEILTRQQEKEHHLAMPKNAVNLKDKIKDMYSKLKNIFSDREERVAFSELISGDEENKIHSFVSLLHLDNQQKVWLEQEGHFEEIWVLLKSIYEKQNKENLAKIRAEIEALEKDHESRIEEDWSMYQEEDDEDEGSEQGDRFETGFSNEIEKEIE